MKEIFISHSSFDKEIVNDFIDEILMGGLDFSRDQIYSTSADDLKNKPGEDWEKGIKEALCNSKVIIILMTLNYRKSEFCLCELGITWATSSEKNPIYFIVDPVSFDNVPGVLRTKEVSKLLDDSHLNSVKDFITDIFKNKPCTVYEKILQGSSVSLTVTLKVMMQNFFRICLNVSNMQRRRSSLLDCV